MKRRKVFAKKMFLAIHQDKSRGKKKKKQHEKYSEKKTKKGSRENSFWQFSGTILEVKAGQITKWKKNMKKIEKGSRNNCFWQSPQDNSKNKRKKITKTKKTKKTGKMNRKKFLLAFLRDNSKVKTGTNSHKGKNMKQIPKNVLKKTVCGNPPGQFQRQKEKT